jgi:hypothetical protein
VFGFQDLRRALLDRHEQPLARQSPVAHLRARVLYSHAETCRAMSQGNRGCHLIYVLPARAGRTSECFLQFIFRKASHDLPSFCVEQRPVNVGGGSYCLRADLKRRVTKLLQNYSCQAIA